MVDIVRKTSPRKKLIRRITYGVVGLSGILGTTALLSRLKPAAPEVDGGTVWRDTVKRGDMLRDVRGLGVLTPLDITWVPAVTDGRVEKRLVLPGMPVKADTVLMVLSNPATEQAAVDAEWQWKQAEAAYNSLKAQLDSTLLDQKATAAQVESDYEQAKLQADRDQQLAKMGLGSELTSSLSKSKAEALATRLQIEKDRVEVLANSVKAQLAAQQAKVEQQKALYDLRHRQFEDLQVRAGIDGILQLLPVEVGQQVTAGTSLARVAQPKHLKAEIKIAETQAKDVRELQSATIDTHNGIIPGHVIRVDPSVVNGTRTVDVALDGPLPPGAVPDLSVDGTIELEHLRDVLYVGRPAFGQPDSTVTLFKVDKDGKSAERVQVKLGRSSVNTIEILGGLEVGDVVILSDMSRWDGFDRIRLTS
jgi:HlyD family secretion protein